MKKIKEYGFSILTGSGFLLMFLFLVSDYRDHSGYPVDRFLKDSENRIIALHGLAERDSVALDAEQKIQAMQLKQWYVTRIHGWGNSTHVMNFGIKTILERDTFSKNDPFGHANQKEKKFIQISDVRLFSNFWFEIEGAKYYANLLNREEIPVRFFADTDGETGLLFPVSSGTYFWANILFWGLGIPFAVLYFIVVLIFPFHVMINISKGQAFVPQNYKKLRWAGILLLISFIIPLLIGWISIQMLDDQAANVFYYPYLSKIFENRYLLVGGIACLLLSQAFKKGYELQQEQNLTV